MDSTSKKGLILFCTCLIVGILVGHYIWPNKNTSKLPNVDEYLNRINTLESIVDSLESRKVYIDHKIDTVEIIIEKINGQYKEDYNTIINNTPTEDYLFFVEYIKCNRERLDSINIF